MNLLFYIWLLSATVQIFYLLYFFRKAANHESLDSKKVENSSKTRAVSLIICARNEAKNLKAHLPAFLAQDYPNFELIIIDDGSTDETEEVISEFLSSNDRISYYRLQDSLPGKKEALEFGISKSKNEILLLSDADCKPSSPDWISLIVSKFNDEREIVLGIGPINYKSGFLNGLQRFENESVALLYSGFALRGKTYMGVGRNLAYKKKLFIEHSGFQNHKHIPSGDDDLFISMAANSQNVALNLHPDARCYSDGPHSWKSWIKQKSRHQSTARYYKGQIKCLLNIYYFSLPIFLLLSATLMLLKCNIVLVICVYLIRHLILFICLKNLNKGHRIKTNVIALLTFDWALLVFYFLSTILLIFGKSDEW